MFLIFFKNIFRCRACIGVLLTSLTLESELRIKSHLQKLLTVAKNLFSHLGDVTVLLRQIMAEARHLSQVKCAYFLSYGYLNIYV